MKKIIARIIIGLVGLLTILMVTSSAYHTYVESPEQFYAMIGIIGGMCLILWAFINID